MPIEQIFRIRKHYFKTQNNRKKKSWKIQEDKILRELVGVYGCRSWLKISGAFNLKNPYNYKRTAQQCRERWKNKIKVASTNTEAQWTAEEEQVLFEGQAKYGNKWIKIAQLLPKRNENTLKNHYYSQVRKFLRRTMLHLKKINFYESNGINPEEFPLCKIQELLKKEKISYLKFSFDLIQDVILMYKKSPKRGDAKGKNCDKMKFNHVKIAKDNCEDRNNDNNIYKINNTYNNFSCKNLIEIKDDYPKQENKIGEFFHYGKTNQNSLENPNQFVMESLKNDEFEFYEKTVFKEDIETEVILNNIINYDENINESHQSDEQIIKNSCISSDDENQPQDIKLSSSFAKGNLNNNINDNPNSNNNNNNNNTNNVLKISDDPMIFESKPRTDNFNAKTNQTEILKFPQNLVYPAPFMPNLNENQVVENSNFNLSSLKKNDESLIENIKIKEKILNSIAMNKLLEISKFKVNLEELNNQFLKNIISTNDHIYDKTFINDFKSLNHIIDCNNKHVSENFQNHIPFNQTMQKNTNNQLYNNLPLKFIQNDNNSIFQNIFNSHDNKNELCTNNKSTDLQNINNISNQIFPQPISNSDNNVFCNANPVNNHKSNLNEKDNYPKSSDYFFNGYSPCYLNKSFIYDDNCTFENGNIQNCNVNNLSNINVINNLNSPCNIKENFNNRIFNDFVNNNNVENNENLKSNCNHKSKSECKINNYNIALLNQNMTIKNLKRENNILLKLFINDLLKNQQD